MKKKIALLLAGAMTLTSLLPTNLFAASHNDVTVRNISVGYGENWLLPAASQGINSTAVTAITNLPGMALNSTLINDGRGNDLSIRFLDTESASPGQKRQFMVTLNNGEFAYYSNGTAPVYNGRGFSTTFDNDTASNPAPTGGGSRWFNPNHGNGWLTSVKTGLFDLVNNQYTNADGTDRNLAAAAIDQMLISNALATEISGTNIGQNLQAAVATALGNPANTTDLLGSAVLGNVETAIENELLDEIGKAGDPADTTIFVNGGSTTLTQGNIWFNLADAAGMSQLVVWNDQSVSDIAKLIMSNVSNSTTVGQLYSQLLALDSANVHTMASGVLGLNSPYMRAFNAQYGYSQTYSRTNGNLRTIEYQIDFERDSNGRMTRALVTYYGPVNRDDVIMLPLAVRAINDGSITASIETYGFSGVTPQSNISVTAGVGSASVNITSDKAYGDFRINLNPIRLSERLPRSINNGEITLTLENNGPSEYYFVNPTSGVNSSGLRVETTLGITTNNLRVTNVDTKGSAFPTEITITVDGVIPSTAYVGSLSFVGLVIAPRNPDLAPYGQEVRVKLSNSTLANLGDPTRTIAVAERTAWSVGVTSNYAGNENKYRLFAGHRQAEAAQVTLTENVVTSWTANKNTTFILTDGEGNELRDVKISGIDIWASNLTNNPFGTDRAWWMEMPSTTGNIGTNLAINNNFNNLVWNNTFNGFRLADLYANSGQLVTTNIVFYLSAAANFEGDVFVKVNPSNDSFSDFISGEGTEVQIATFRPAAEVEVTFAETEIGFQTTMEITELKIAETDTGAWNRGEVTVYVGEYGEGYPSEYMYFGTTSARYNAILENANDTTMQISSVSRSTRRTLAFNVDRMSSHVGNRGVLRPATVVVTDIVLNIDRTVPHGSYDIIVGGPAIAQNFADFANMNNVGSRVLGDYFEVAGVVEPDVIFLATPGGTEPADPFAAQIAIQSGDVVLVNNEEVELSDENGRGPVYIDENTNSFMVPIRFISRALGIDNQNGIFWNEAEQTCTIFAPDRTLVFTNGSADVTVNGTRVRMTDVSGSPVTAHINEEFDRFYLPFRALGNILGVSVGYDAETGTGWYNNPNFIN